MSTAIISNNFIDRAHEHLQMALNGHEPLSKIARENLHPFFFNQISFPKRVVHLIQSIALATPLINRIADFVTGIFFSSPSSPIPKRFDREYRMVSYDQVLGKLTKEKQLAIINNNKGKNINFNPARSTLPSAIPFSREQHKLTHGNSILNVDIAWMQGKRETMEDEHLATTFSIAIGKKTYPVSLFGVFDGHGGTQASKYLKANMVEYIKKYLERNETLSDGAIFNALKLAFVDLDRHFTGRDGSTACISILLDGNLWVANSGDTRAVLNNGGETEQLSNDAKPDLKPFYKRVIKRGGKVVERGVARVNGTLAVAGAIGDHFLIGKEGYKCVSPRPKITKTPLSEIAENAELIIACDGLWDVCSSQQAVDSKLSARGLIHAAYMAGSTDNISAMTISIPGSKKTQISKLFFFLRN